MPKPTLRDRMFGPTEREKYLDKEVEAVHNVLARMAFSEEQRDIYGGDSYANVAEGLRDVEMMLDVQGWTNVFDYDDDAGLTLRQVKDASKLIRELIVGNPFVQNGVRIHHAHVWGGGLDFQCYNRTGTRKEAKQLPVVQQSLMEEVRSQRYVFGNDAHEELERGAFSDGNVYLLGQDSTRRFQRIQIHEITADLRNPNNTEEIWAYRRVWYQRPTADTETGRQEMVRWYYTDIYDGPRRKSISHAGKRETVEPGYTIIDKAFNRQIGWAYGVPDALAIVAWSRLYKEFLVNGYIMSRSLARLAFKVTSKTTEGAGAAATTVVAPGQSGSTLIEGAGNNLQPLLTAGRGYDFASGNPLASGMAAGLGVSLLALTANPAAASGSNAAAQTLDPIAKATAAVRRLSWDDFWLRVFRYMGLQQRLAIVWHDIPSDTIQRIMQAVTLLDGLEVMGADVLQKVAAKAMQIDNPGPIPDGWLPKSQRKSGADDGSTAGNSGATGGSGQGSDDGSGPSADDHDDDD